MNNIQKLHEALKDNPELQRKITEEAARLVENKEADEQEALIRTVRKNLDIELTREEVDALFAKIREEMDALSAKTQELDPEQLEQASGGLVIGEKKVNPETITVTGAASGLVVGAAIGTTFLPLVGTIVGGVIGTAVGYVGSQVFNAFDD